MTQVAVTVIGTNLVMAYGTHEAAVAAMEAMQALFERDEDDMCPNCVTPWKCNGPHIGESDTADASITGGAPPVLMTDTGKVAASMLAGWGMDWGDTIAAIEAEAAALSVAFRSPASARTKR